MNKSLNVRMCDEDECVMPLFGRTAFQREAPESLELEHAKIVQKNTKTNEAICTGMSRGKRRKKWDQNAR